MRKATPPITPPMIAFLECDVEVEMGGEAEDDIVLGVRTQNWIFLVEVLRYRDGKSKKLIEEEGILHQGSRNTYLNLFLPYPS